MNNTTQPVAEEETGKSLGSRDFNHFTFVASIKSKLVDLLYSLENDGSFRLEEAGEKTGELLAEVIDFEDYFTQIFLDNRDKKRQNALMKEIEANAAR
ncbi:hypothetical protein [Paenibacillus sp. IHBB 3054]|uniref:hypothetical protein n=1 Tax=Paenibacillus sp. IHBB 3054 TaxID=3425689 RepID=UPI003F67E160